MEELKFDIGQWISNSYGYGQIMYIRQYFVEDYENHRRGRINGEFIGYFYICKILCGFDGKIKKSKRININSSINPIDIEGLKFVKNIKLNQKEEYKKYLLFDDKNNICNQLFLNYKIDILDFDLELVENQIDKISNRLYPAFTYKEFVKLFKEYDFPFKLESIINFDLGYKDSIMLRFDSQLYKTKDKEAIFDKVNIFFPKILEK